MAAKDKLKVGVVGTGYLGRFHAQKYAELESTELVGVADLNIARAKEIAEECNTKAYESYVGLFGKVDAVSIVTPTQTHCEIGTAFLAKGIDVLIEKPMAKSIEEAELLIKAAKESGAVLQVGHLERFNAAVVALKDKVNNPVFIESHRLSPFPNRATDVDVVLDLMIHDIDIILNLVDADIESVDAVGIPVISDKVDIANARIKFVNGCVANVTASRVSKETMRRIRLFQSDAYISIDYAAQHISISKLIGKGKVDASTPSTMPSIEQEELDIERKDSLMEEIKSFVDCSTKGTAPLVSGTDGKRALKVATAIQASVDESIESMKAHIGGTTKDPA